jgi:hypothetical protein
MRLSPVKGNRCVGERAIGGATIGAATTSSELAFPCTAVRLTRQVSKILKPELLYSEDPDLWNGTYAQTGFKNF